MKTAWELALERSGGTLNELDDDRKKAIAQIDRACQARLAEAELAYTEKLKRTSDYQAIEQLKEDLAVERASIRSKAARDKEKIRSGT
ncbi:MAG: hypothetical protein PHH77_02615 [Victivallaceae bacterium]|nr:hypothetical protein [Victivallaceae bacterium]